jgi:hypothetical protein
VGVSTSRGSAPTRGVTQVTGTPASDSRLRVVRSSAAGRNTGTESISQRRASTGMALSRRQNARRNVARPSSPMVHDGRSGGRVTRRTVVARRVPAYPSVRRNPTRSRLIALLSHTRAFRLLWSPDPWSVEFATSLSCSRACSPPGARSACRAAEPCSAPRRPSCSAHAPGRSSIRWQTPTSSFRAVPRGSSGDGGNGDGGVVDSGQPDGGRTDAGAPDGGASGSDAGTGTGDRFPVSSAIYQTSPAPASIRARRRSSPTWRTPAGARARDRLQPAVLHADGRCSRAPSARRPVLLARL